MIHLHKNQAQKYLANRLEDLRIESEEVYIL